MKYEYKYETRRFFDIQDGEKLKFLNNQGKEGWRFIKEEHSRVAYSDGIDYEILFERIIEETKDQEWLL